MTAAVLVGTLGGCGRCLRPPRLTYGARWAVGLWWWTALPRVTLCLMSGLLAFAAQREKQA